MTLTPEQLERVEYFREMYGSEQADAAKNTMIVEEPPPPARPVYPTKIERTGPTPGTAPRAGALPEMELPYTPERERENLYEQAVKQETLNNMQLGFTDPGAAAEKARRSVAKATAKAVDVHQRLQPYASKKRIEELSGLEAVREAFRPQVLQSAERVKQRNEEVVRSRAWREEQLELIDPLIPDEYQGDQRELLKMDKYHERLKRDKGDWIASATRVYRRKIGVDPDPNTTDIEALGQQLWMEWVKDIAPELYNEERDNWQALKDGASPAFKWAMESIVETQGERHAPGTITESMFATGLRDLVGTLRFIADPVAQWATWEMDEGGRPLDPEDRAYKMWQMAPDWYKDAPYVGGLPLPFQPSTRTWADQERPAIETDDILRDIAYSIAQGRMIGDDLMTLDRYQESWEKLGFPNAPWWIGLGAEIAIPISAPFKVAHAPLKAAASTARYTERLARGTALANGASKAARVAEAMADPMIILRAKHADWAARKVLHNVPGVDTFEGGTNALQTARVLGDAVADTTVTPQVALRHISGGTGRYVSGKELGLVARSPIVKNALVKATDDAGNISRKTMVYELRKHVGKMQFLASTKKLSRPVQRALEIGATSTKAGGPITPIGAQAGRYANELVRVGMKGSPAIDIETQALSMVASNSVRGDLLDWAPRLFGETVLQGRTILTKKAWDTIGPDVTKRVVGILEHDAVGPVRAFKNPIVVANHLVTALGPEAVKQSKVWTGIVNGLRKGKPLHEIDYHRVHAEIQGRVIRNMINDSVELQWAGRARSAAMEPQGRRIQTMRTADEIIQLATRTGLEAGEKFAPRLSMWEGTKSWLARGKTGTRFNYDAARTPAVVGEFMEATNARLVNVVADLNADIIAKQKGYLAKGLSREKAAEHAIQDIIDDAVKSVETNIKGAPKDTQTFLGWKDITAKFFGNSDITDAAIKLALGLDPKAGTIKGIKRLTPDNFRKFLGKLRKDSPLLQEAGLKTGPWAKKIGDPAASDNIFAAFAAFAAEQKAQKMVRAEVARLVETNPAFKVQLHHPLEYKSKETLKMIEKELKGHIPVRSTPGVAPGVPNPAVLKADRLTVFDKLLGEYAKRAKKAKPPADLAERVKRATALRALVASGKTLSDGALNQARRLINQEGKYGAARPPDLQYFHSAESAAKAVVKTTEDMVASSANNIMRNIAALMTSDQRLHLVKQAFERKIATNDLYAVPQDVNQMMGGVGQLLDDDFLRGMLKEAGVPKESLDVAAKALKDIMWKTIATDADIQAQGLLRSWGFTSGRKVTEIPVGLKPQIFGMEAGKDVAFMHGPDYADLAGRLQKAVASGGLDDALQSLRYTGNEEFVSLAWRSVHSLANTMRRVTISGMLGGVVTPITRFHGLNAFTAPAIAAMTSGWRGAGMALGVDLKANSLLNWAAVKFGAKGDEVVFLSDNGIKWTRRGLEDAIARNNVKFSQVSYEFHDAVIEGIMRTAKVDKNLAAVAKRTEVRKWIDPRNKNFWNQFAETTDNYWRKNIFIGALKEGKSELEAAKMAQNVLLDYGAVHKAEKEVVSRYVLFWAFRRQMFSEVIDELLRGGNRLRQMTAWHAYQHQHSRSWAYDKDYHKSRLYSVMGPTFDRVAQSGVYGPGNPGLESFNDIVNVSMWVMNWRQGIEPTAAGMWEGMSETMFTPEVRFLQEMINYGPDEKGAGYVPPHQVAALMRFGAWTDFTNFFQVEPVALDRRRPGDPTFHGMQFRFKNKKSYNEYLLYTYALTRLGIMRTVDDIAKTSIAAGAAPEGAEMKGLAEPSPMMHALNLQTAMNSSSEARIRLRALQKVERELRTMAREALP
jgi:hypothetical protein